MSQVRPCLVVDAGNTAVKAAMFEGEVAISQVRSRNIEEFQSWLKRQPVPDNCFAAASAPARLKALSTLFSKSVPLDIITRDRIGLVIATREPQRTGIDRLLNALAAFHPGQGALVVDVGSAITWDVVDPGAVFLGGAIAPGPRLQLGALHTETERLPDLPVPAALPVTTLGRDSSDAMVSGVILGSLGAIRAVARGILSELDFRPRLVLTGGDAPIFAAALSEDGFAHDPLLTLRGILAAGRGALKNNQKT